MKFHNVVCVKLLRESLSLALLLILTGCDPATWIVGSTAVVGTKIKKVLLEACLI